MESDGKKTEMYPQFLKSIGVQVIEKNENNHVQF